MVFGIVGDVRSDETKLTVCPGDEFQIKLGLYNHSPETVNVLLTPAGEDVSADADQMVVSVHLPGELSYDWVATEFQLLPDRLHEEAIPVTVEEIPSGSRRPIVRLAIVGDPPSGLEDGLEGDVTEPIWISSCDDPGPTTTTTTVPASTLEPPKALFVVLEKRSGDGKSIAALPCGETKFVYELKLYNYGSNRVSIMIATNTSDPPASTDQVVLSPVLPDGMEPVGAAWNSTYTVEAGDEHPPIALDVRYKLDRNQRRISIAQLSVAQYPKETLPDGVVGDLHEPLVAPACRGGQ
jgi:hypothetical protein